jgi:transposase
MLGALVSGTSDPGVLADLAIGKLCKRIPALREALEGRFDQEHVLIVSQILSNIDCLDEAIDQLSEEIEQRIGPFAPQRELLKTIPGVNQRTRRGTDRRDRRGHERLPDPQAPRLMGRRVPRQRPVRPQTPLRQNPQGSKWLRATLTESARCGRGRRPPVRPARCGLRQGARRRQHARNRSHAAAPVSLPLGEGALC